MSSTNIAAEISRINTAVGVIRAAMANLGISVSNSDKIDTLAAKLRDANIVQWKAKININGTPNSTIKITNTTDGTSANVTLNSSGTASYQVPKPGTYTLSVM